MTFTITKAWIKAHRTPNGAWTKRQLEAIGVNWPAVKGWQKAVIGTEITAAKKQAFESGAISQGARSTVKELQQQIIGLNKKIVELQAIIDDYRKADK